MRYVFICGDDWANLQHELAQALRAAITSEDTVQAVKLRTHPFGYDYQCPLRTVEQMAEMTSEADVVFITHSDHELLPYVNRSSRIVPIHTGTKYRQNAQAINEAFSFTDLQLTDQTEFFGLGAKNLRYITVPVTIDKWQLFSHESSRPYIVGHYPSNPHVKGTDRIIAMMAKVRTPHRFDYSTTRLPHPEHLRRIATSDIYVELFAPQQGGREYGCYGVTAFEAAAMGRVVVTQNLHPEVYEEEYGYCPFILADNEGDFIAKMEYVLNMPPVELRDRQTKHYMKMKEYHSHNETGLRILNYLNSK